MTQITSNPLIAMARLKPMALGIVLSIGLGACTLQNEPENRYENEISEQTESEQVETASTYTTAEQTPHKAITSNVDRTRAIAAPAATSHFQGLMQDQSGHYNPQYNPERSVRPKAQRENYAQVTDNPVKRVAEEPVSTFSIDVDTGSYANVRRFINAGQLPHPDVVRIEELINYFNYDYETPANEDIPFSFNTQLMPTPWNENTRLLKVGLRGYDVEREKLPPSNLVFLIDVSGSMQSNDKLSLLARSLELLTTKMRGDDRIAIVTYAGASGVVLESTKGNEQSRIKRAIRSLTAGGSTNGAAGISLAYDIARENFIADGINRVILATDGDFNVGVVDFSALIDMVEKRRQSGISLTALGFGTGNLNDHLMEQLADKGNGNYAYIDTLNEANKVLIDEMSATLLTIASDVKIQIEFNPALVSEYRLVGYENRALSREDFNNDKIDAGEIGAGHTVTALYEIALTGSGGERIEPLRYGKKLQTPMPENNNGNTQDDQSSLEVAHLRLRYKKPGESVSSRVEKSILMSDAHPSIAELNDDARFAVSVAAFGQYLRGGDYLGNFGISEIRALAKDSRGADNHGYRAEFLRLLSLAENLLPPEQPVKVSTIDDSGR